MKTKLILTALLAVIISSCSSPNYLPTVDDIDVNTYGSYISITLETMETIENVYGELIAIDSSKIIILTESEDRFKKCVIIPKNEVKRFKLQYATGKYYGWAIPLYCLATLSHGWYAAATLPINLIVTLIVTASGASNTFTYSESELAFNKLKMFARFPQGIPPGIKIGSIK